MSQPARPTIDEMRAARERLRPVVRETPLLPLHEHLDGEDILLKVETFQPVTSFKIRGVFNAVASLDASERRRGVSTVSAGNTAQALAWSARHFGIQARSLMPDSAPESKVEAVRAYGGEPVLVPVAEVFRYLKEHGWEQEPYAFIHPWTNRDVMTGHASMGLEILEQAGDVATVFIPVGGGGLLAGVGSALKALEPSIRIAAVEPAACPSLHQSLAAGKPVSVDCNTICDGVAVPYMTEEMFPLLRELVDESFLVTEEEVKAAVKGLALQNKLVVEGSGALAVAATQKMAASARGKSVCLVTGGSIDAAKLVEILSDASL